MDLATGAKDVFVMMTLLTREGASKIVEACTYPLTGVGCVTRVYTDKAVFLTGPDGVQVRETFGCTLEELQELVPVPLTASPRRRTLTPHPPARTGTLIPSEPVI